MAKTITTGTSGLANVEAVGGVGGLPLAASAPAVKPAEPPFSQRGNAAAASVGTKPKKEKPTEDERKARGMPPTAKMRNKMKLSPKK